MSIPSEERIIMDVEVKLQEDENGAFKESLHHELTQLCATIDSRLKAGALPDEYKSLGEIKKGLEAADAILERLWLFHHSTA